MRWSYVLLEKYRTVTNVVGTILIAWILSAIAGQLIGLFLSKNAVPLTLPPAETGDDRSLFASLDEQTVDFYLPICERNIFDSQRRTPCGGGYDDEEEAVEEDMDSAPVRSDLAVTLLGTLVSSNPDASFATIQPKGGTAENFHVGETMLGEAKIYDIQRNRVFFTRNGHREYIEVEHLPSIYGDGASASAPSSGEGIKRVGDKSIVDRNKVDSVLGNLNDILQQSRMVPNFENGVVNGFKVFAIKPGSIFSELGLKNGDVIQRINGTEIDTVEKAIPMLQLLKTSSSISIDLTRGGAKKTLSIEIR